MSKISMYNPEGYVDPTAHEALSTIQAEMDAADERTRRLVSRLRQQITDAGYELLNRMVLKDNETGRIYK